MKKSSDRLHWHGAVLLVLGAVAPAASLKAAEAVRPNIVYLLTDQWRASATGYAGDPNVKTPNLDRLATQSYNFRNAVSTQPVCTAHRAALQTGRFPTSTGMFLNDAHLPDEELCMAEIFKSAGYTTGYIGKWHLDGHGRSAYIPPERRQGWEWWRGNECTHDYNHSAYYENDSSVKKFWPGYDSYAQTKAAQEYIRGRQNSSQPFVLMLCYGTPHFPSASAPADLKALYPPESIQLPANVSENWMAEACKQAQGYYAHCTAVDRCVGEIMKTLDETGLAENTLLIFTSDHGESLGSHGIKPFKKLAFWNETAGVPFLMRYPAGLGKEGRTLRMPITTTDILPTLLGFAGVPIPPSIEGEDLSPRLRAGRDDADRTALFMAVHTNESEAAEYRALRNGRYTFVRALDGPKYLFDNEKDPLQLTNLLAEPEFAPLRDDLNRRLTAELARIKDDFRPGPSYLAEWYPGLSKLPIPYDQDGTLPVVTPKRQSLTAGKN